jgi:hypothetical protein
LGARNVAGLQDENARRAFPALFRFIDGPQGRQILCKARPPRSAHGVSCGKG